MDKRTMELLEEAYLIETHKNEETFDRELILGGIGQYAYQLNTDVQTLIQKIRKGELEKLSDEQVNLLSNTVVNAGVAIRNAIRSVE